MLQLYDKNHKKIEGLIKYEDYKIESVLSSCDKTLSFLYPKIDSKNIELEGYIQNKNDEFVIKEISNSDDDYISVLTKMNVEALEGKEWDRFESIGVTVKDSLNLACAGTGWTVNLIDNIKKKRTVRKTACSSWDVIQEIKDTYRVELIFDSLNKVIKVYEKVGADKGVYFMDSLNLINLNYNNDTNDYYTRIRAEGKDGLVLDGKGYLENYQYSNKVKTLYWKDTQF
ncbi:MAG: phage tail protein [Clostridium sp.]|nr:phage tail protein [Clostridium sp.]